MSAFLKIAKDKDGNLLYIDDVPNGKNCGCFCPSCGKALEARNAGPIREHHFKHCNGHTCAHAVESSLHLLAKSVIVEAGGIMLPTSQDANRPSGFVHLENVMMEQWHEEYDFKPDVEGTLPDGRKLFIEFVVSHKVSNKKRNTIIENDLLCIEIDVNWLEISDDVLLEYITKSDKNRYWITQCDLSTTGDSFSSNSIKNPRFTKAKDLLVDAFHKKLLAVVDNSERLVRNIWGSSDIDPRPKCHNLCQLGYDVCIIDTNYRGFDTDILLHRSNKNEGYIAINFRGRRRNKDAKIPEQLRLIDIIIKDETDEELKEMLADGQLSPQNEKMCFLGTWKNIHSSSLRNRRRVSPRKLFDL